MRHVESITILGSNISLHDSDVGTYRAQLLSYKDGGMLVY